jgi:hypothetical protein
MKRLALAALLSILSTGSSADWVLLGRTANRQLYCDPATITKAGNVAKMWCLDDYNAVQETESGGQYLSDKTQYEFDCQARRYRIYFISVFSAQMGAGNVVASDDSTDWDAVDAASVAELRWKFACGRK